MSTTNNNSSTTDTSGKKEKRKIAPTTVEPTRDEQRLINQNKFEDWYIDDSVQHEPLSSSTEVSPKTVPEKPKPKSKKRAGPDSTSDEMSTPSKKMKTSDKAIASGSNQVITPSRVSKRISEKKQQHAKKRAADDDAQDEQESPLAKKSKTGHDKTSLSVKGKGKAPVIDSSPTPPPISRTRTRRPGAASQLRAAGKLPKKPLKSTQSAAEKNQKQTVVKDELSEDDDDDAEGADKNAVVPADFEGVSSGYGSSAEKPKDAMLTQPWHCASRMCTTGMTWYPRKNLGRKAISNYFGRNKKETGYIDDEVWHIYCRKDYQTSKYDADKINRETGTTQGIFNWHMMNVRTQFDRLKLWRPEATFNVQLNKNTHARNAEWHKCCRNHDRDREAAQAEFDRHPKWGVKERKPNKKGELKPLSDEEAFPVEMVDNFDKTYCGEAFDYDRVTEVLDYVQELFDDGSLTQMPPIEFLISQLQEDEEVIDPKHNYMRWLAQCEEQEFETPDGSAAGDEEDVADDEEVLGEEVDEEEDADVDDDEEVEDVVQSIETDPDAPATSGVVPLNAQPKKKTFKLRPTDPNNPRPLSTTYGACEGNGRRKRTPSDGSSTIEVKHRP